MATQVLPTALRNTLWATDGDAHSDEALARMGAATRLLRDFSVTIETVSVYEMGPYVTRVRYVWRKMTSEQRLAAISAWLTEWKACTPEERVKRSDAALALTTRIKPRRK